MNLHEFLTSLREGADRTAILAGIFSLATGMLFAGFRPLDQWIFAGCSLLGATLIAVGSIALLELYSPNLLSKKNLAACFLIAAAISAALAFVSLIFGKYISSIYSVPITGVEDNGAPLWTPEIFSHLQAVVVYPNAWLFIPLSLLSVCLIALSALCARFADKF